MSSASSGLQEHWRYDVGSGPEFIGSVDPDSARALAEYEAALLLVLAEDELKNSPTE